MPSEPYIRLMEEREQEMERDIESLDYGEQRKYYPNGSDLRPFSDTHRHIISRIMDMAEASRSVQRPMYDEFRTLEWLNEGYMPEDAWDAAVRQRDERKPVAVTVPTSLVMREMYAAYMARVFFRPYGIYGYRGLGSTKAIVGAALMERVNARQAYWFHHKRAWMSAFKSAFTYGRAPLVLGWEKQYSTQIVNETVTELLAAQLERFGIDARRGMDVLYEAETLSAEGTELEPLDIYQCFFDPSVPPRNFGKSGYLGYMYKTTSGLLMQHDGDEEMGYFNLEAAEIIAENGAGQSRFWNRDIGRGVRLKLDTDTMQMPHLRGRGELHVLRMYIRLIPRDWALGESKRPEWWIVEIAGDKVIIRARRCTEPHRCLPAVDISPRCDGHSIFPVSHALSTSKIHMFQNFLAKSTADATMTILTGRIFFNPRVVNKEDLERGGQGKFVRVTNSEYDNRSIRDFVYQMDVSNPTERHMVTMQELDNVARMANGLGDMVMGNLSGLPERPGQQGINVAQAGMFSQLEANALMIDEQGIQEVARQMAYNTMAFMSQNVQVSVLGRYADDIRRMYGLQPRGEGFVEVSPFDFDPNFEVVPYGGAQIWQKNPQQMAELMKTLLAVEGVPAQIAQDYRIPELFAAVWRELGIEEINEFRIPFEIRVEDDAIMQQHIASGNYVSAADVGAV